MGMISQQALLFFTCVKTGIVMGMLYDLIRVFRKIIPHPNWVVQIEDLLYWIACGCFSFVMIYWENYGQIRGFVFMGILIGITLYFSTASILFMNIATRVINWVKKVISKMIHFILIPIKCIISNIQIHRQKLKAKRKRCKDKIKAQLKIIKEKK